MITAKLLFDRCAYWVLVAIYAFFSVVTPLEPRLTPLGIAGGAYGLRDYAVEWLW